VPGHYWEGFATFVLEAAYKATMWAAVLNAQRGASNLLGGGAFGNESDWIIGAMRVHLASSCHATSTRE
jgi:hypothetical protein